MSFQSTFIYQLDQQLGISNGTFDNSALLRVKFNDVAASIMKRRLRTALGCDSKLHKTKKLGPQMEAIVLAIVEQSKGDMTQALLRLRLDVQLAEYRSNCAAVQESEPAATDMTDFSGVGGNSALFNLLGKCLYSKRVPWTAIETHGLIPPGRAAQIRLRQERLGQILLTTPPFDNLLSLEEQFLRDNIGWLLPLRLTSRAQRIHSQEQFELTDDYKWAEDVDPSTAQQDCIGSSSPPAVIEGEDDLTLDVIGRGPLLTDASISLNKADLSPALLRPPSYFSPKLILRSLTPSDAAATLGMLLKSLPLVVTNDLRTVQQGMVELASLDHVKSRAYSPGIDRDWLELETASLACDLVRDIHCGIQTGGGSSRSLLKIGRSLDRELSLAQKSRRDNITNGLYYSVYSSPRSNNWTTSGRWRRRPLSVTKFEQEILPVLWPSLTDDGVTSSGGRPIDTVRRLLKQVGPPVLRSPFEQVASASSSESCEEVDEIS